MNDIAQVRQTAMALRAEESRLRRLKREEEVARVARQKQAAQLAQLRDIEHGDARFRARKQAKASIIKRRAQMARDFLFKQKQIREGFAMASVVP